ncbi:MAG: hypothetical protein U0103_26095 [Candidatus Obscuribacterales bacterium]
MKNSDTENQAAMREAEKERYLATLRARELERARSKEQSKQAEVVRAEKAIEEAEAFRAEISSRTDFREALREKRKADAIKNQEVMDKLGQEYRKKLKAFNSRFTVKLQDLDKLNEAE